MTNVTRQDLEACARLLGYDVTVYAGMRESYVRRLVVEDDSDILALARAAKLIVDYDSNVALLGYGGESLSWPADGTEAECIIKAAAAVQIKREKQQ